MRDVSPAATARKTRTRDQITLDPDRFPELFDGVLGKRILAFVADAVNLLLITAVAMVIFVILGVLSFGLLFPAIGIVMPALWLAYFTLTIGGPRSATPGMRLNGIEVRTWDGARPGYLQGALQSIVFYLSTVVTIFVLLVPLFNRRRRCLHDYLIGTVVINAPDAIRPHETVITA